MGLVLIEREMLCVDSVNDEYFEVISSVTWSSAYGLSTLSGVNYNVVISEREVNMAYVCTHACMAHTL